MKKREKAKQKSARQWKERLDKVASDETAKIDKREGNILKRKNKGAPVVTAGEEGTSGGGTKGVKRPRLAMVMRDKERGEGEKGKGEGESPRPGFEGKKNRPINKNSKSSGSKKESHHGKG